MAMPQAEQQPSADHVLRTLPILMIGLMSGVVMFAGMGVFVSTSKPAGGATPLISVSPDVLLMVMGVLVLLGALAFFVVGKLAAGMARKAVDGIDDEEERRGTVAKVLMTTSIMRAGACEVSGLVGAFIVYSTGNLLGLVGVGFAVLFIATLVPARSRFDRLHRDATGARFVM